MVISEPGKVTERITFLGRRDSCLYLVDGGGESVLVGGGMAYVVPDILEQIRRYGIREREIRRVIILHAHFDHCGAAPFLKRRWPWMRVTASVRGKDLLSNPEVSKAIAALNQQFIVRAGLEEEAARLGFGFTGIEVEETAREGDLISCGDVILEVLEVPGHSSCSIAVYVPQEKALFASDAAGVRSGDYFFSAGNSNFDHYQQSLDKMAKYEVKVVAGEHYGAAVGEEARTFLPRAIEEAKKTRALLEASYRRTRDVQKSTEEMTKIFMAQPPPGFLDREVIAIVAGQMVKHIARTMEEKRR
ncbi:MAG: MBL fold metallo-hydrolase [Proteobacteria bacterium]|nr:MBL fold metallo-hydrolase [Pseudomonadota bacterium]